jgi:NAD(P)-dependent dehydrogenase (short-subunit alcohol dehydrogenase family)
MPANTTSTHPSPVALITGAGSGIGRETALDLASRGWTILALGRSPESLAATIAACANPTSNPTRQPTHHLTHACDVADHAAARAAVDLAFARFGRLDALINNAGHAPKLPIHEHTNDIITRTFAVNALGPANMIAQAFAHWTALPTSTNPISRGPAIVNVGSMATVDPFPGFFAYAASKAALNLLTRSCHNEGDALGIRAFAVAPGAVETPLLRSIFPAEALPSSRTLEPATVASVIVECVLGLRDTHRGEVILVPSP